MEGGGDLPVYRCDTNTDCLNPALGQVTVPAIDEYSAAIWMRAARQSG